MAQPPSAVLSCPTIMSRMLTHLRAWKERWLAYRLLSRFVSRGALCFDVGANIGDITDLFLKLGARVVAVEPQAENLSRMERRFSSSPRLTLVPKAIGAEDGSAELLVCNASDCSSLSAEFAATLSRSGRVPPTYKWDQRQTVDVTTLDALIAQFGKPDFVKIDVEGYEAEVLKGLSHPLPAVSFEFTPERLQPAFDCIAHLATLGSYEFNFTVGREHRFVLSGWADSEDIARELKDHEFQKIIGPGGDIYARLVG